MKSRKASLLAVSVVLLLTAGQYASAEIPHENFDLVSTDMNLVVQLLNQGLNATEMALVSCIDGRPANASQNLTLLDTILEPVAELISEIENLATSYYSLRYLTPPFEKLALGGHRFILNQSIFLNCLASLKSYVGKTLFALESVEVGELIASSRTTVFNMNSNLNTMDNATEGVSNLLVENTRVFDTTYLEELIDRLRMLLDEYQTQLDSLFFIMQWGEPFLLLILDDDEYYLGEKVKITGYLYNGPAPIVGKAVDIYKDGMWLDTVPTNDNGTFDAAWDIFIDKDELGRHNITATAVIEGYFLEDKREIVVLKIPTNLTLWINGERFPPDETIVATSLLEDYIHKPLEDKTVEYQLDNRYIDLMTSATGQAELVLKAAELEWGRHYITARFNGTEIYDPAENVTQFFDVNYNVSLQLSLSSNRVKQGDNVTIKATLQVNNTRTLPDHEISLKIDDTFLVSGITNEDGDFVYKLNTKNTPSGTHFVTAWFFSTELKYEDAVSPVQILIIYVPSSGEHGDGGDWWDTLVGNVYWLLLLIIIIMILAVLMLSKDAIENARVAGLRKAAGLKTPGVTVGTIPVAEDMLPPPEFPVSGEVSGLDFSAMPPRVAIVKRYGLLLEALRVWRKIPIQANMTAREIGELLRRTGYPADETTQLTGIFERAMYSARETTSADWERFSSLVDAVQYFGAGAK